VRQSHRIDYLGAILLASLLTAVVLFTSLGGTTWPWSSPWIIGLMAASVLLLPLFVAVEQRAAEPMLPMSLFRDHNFALTSATNFVIGLALFGAITYLPLYLQVTKATSPTRSGLELTPMMGGVLVTSIVSGQLISRFGRYRMFPILGTGVMTIGLFLLSRLGVETATVWTMLFAFVLGFGLGSVMQVLILIVQNSVDPRQIGVATSGATTFRQIGGSIGVSLFGAIFASRLVSELAVRLPGRGLEPKTTPAAILALPPNVHAAYIDAFAAALQPVFLVAAGIGAVAFLLTWFIKEAPLRTTSRLGDAIPPPRDERSAAEAVARP